MNSTSTALSPFLSAHSFSVDLMQRLYALSTLAYTLGLIAYTTVVIVACARTCAYQVERSLQRNPLPLASQSSIATASHDSTAANTTGLAATPIDASDVIPIETSLRQSISKEQRARFALRRLRLRCRRLEETFIDKKEDLFLARNSVPPRSQEELDAMRFQLNLHQTELSDAKRATAAMGAKIRELTQEVASKAKEHKKMMDALQKQDQENAIKALKDQVAELKEKLARREMEAGGHPQRESAAETAEEDLGRLEASIPLQSASWNAKVQRLEEIILEMEISAQQKEAEAAKEIARLKAEAADAINELELCYIARARNRFVPPHAERYPDRMRLTLD